MSKLVNVGSLCIDLVYKVPSIAGPGETIASSQRQVFAGGKGLNQSVAAARAGAVVNHYGAVGEDGDMLLDVLRGDGVETAGILRLKGPSGHAVIQVDDSGQNAIFVSGGSNLQLPESLIEQAVTSLQPGDWVLLQNEINDVDQVMRKAAEHGAAVAFNVAPPDQRIHDYPVELLRLLVVNEPEAMALAGADSSALAFTKLVERCPDTHIVLTRGKDGLLFRDADSGSETEMGSFSVQAVDETAAGDAFVGYLLAGLVSGLPIAQTVTRASAAGALAVTKEGASPSVPGAAAVAELLSQQTLSSSSA